MVSQILSKLDNILSQKHLAIQLLSNHGISIDKSNTLQDVIKEITQLHIIYFCARGNELNSVTIRLKGTGTATVMCGNDCKEVTLKQAVYTEIVFDAIVEESDFYITHCDDTNIIDIDVSYCGISSFYCYKQYTLNKIVIHNNELTEIDVSQCPELQFLHMFNNPICADKEKMQQIIKQLPDRNEKPFGSIILYDWVNLGLCGYFNAADSLFYHDKEYKYPLKTYANEIYRDIASIEHPWYQYVDNKFVELTDYNSMIMLRRELEGLDKSSWTYTNKEGSIFKNWVFGSAIQYNEEAWKYCDIPFRDAHVADIWETAEKGEGTGITSFDANNWFQPSINFNRMYAYSWAGFPDSAYNANPEALNLCPVPVYETPEDVPEKVSNVLPFIDAGCYKVRPNVIDVNDSASNNGQFSTTVSLHGDSCYSLMGDRGKTAVADMTYGIAPEARYYLFGTDSTTTNQLRWTQKVGILYSALVAYGAAVSTEIIKQILEEGFKGTAFDFTFGDLRPSDINLMTRSISGWGNLEDGYTLETSPTHTTYRKLNTEAFKLSFGFSSQGNSGEGFPWTSDRSSLNLSNGMGRYGCFVSSVNSFKQFSAYTTADTSDKSYKYSYGCYGEYLRAYGCADKYIKTGSGTSYASPVHTALTALLCVVYGKINNIYQYLPERNMWQLQNSELNKNKLTELIHAHLLTPVNEPRCVIGNGILDMLHYSAINNTYNDIKYTTAVITPSNTVDIYDKANIHRISDLKHADSIDEGWYGDNDITKLVMTNTAHTECVPLVSGEHHLTLYSNHLNEIEDSTKQYGITDDLSKNIFYTTVDIIAESSYKPTEPVTDCRKAEATSANANEFSRVCSALTECPIKDGFTVTAALQINNGYTAIDNFLDIGIAHLGISSKSSTKRCYIQDNGDAMPGDNKQGTFLMIDYPTATSYRGHGYLHQLAGAKSVWTLRKRLNQDVIDVFVNGQLIKTHKSLKNYAKDEKLDKVTSITSTSSPINCIMLCIHNKPLSDAEVIQHSLYVHSTYCR